MKGDIEDVCTGIAAALRSPQFADCLAAVEADKGDGLTPLSVDPEAVHSGERAIQSFATECDVSALDVAYDQGSEAKEGTQRIQVVWSVSGDSEPGVITSVLRLVRATRDLLWQSVLDGTFNIAPIRVETEDYSELVRTNGAAPLLKGGRLILSVVSITQ